MVQVNEIFYIKKQNIDLLFLFFLFEDYIVPPQENNALFLMTNFIRTDQEHKRCAGIKFV
jgi:hypothetical protein